MFFYFSKFSNKMQHIKHNTANLPNQLCNSSLLITFSFVWTVNFYRFSVIQTCIRVSFKNRAIYFVYYYHVTIIFTIKPAIVSLKFANLYFPQLFLLAMIKLTKVCFVRPDYSNIRTRIIERRVVSQRQLAFFVITCDNVYN